MQGEMLALLTIIINDNRILKDSKDYRYVYEYQLEYMKEHKYYQLRIWWKTDKGRIGMNTFSVSPQRLNAIKGKV